MGFSNFTEGGGSQRRFKRRLDGNKWSIFFKGIRGFRDTNYIYILLYESCLNYYLRAN